MSRFPGNQAPVDIEPSPLIPSDCVNFCKKIRTLLPLLCLQSVGFYLIVSGFEDVRDLSCGIGVVVATLFITFFLITDDNFTYEKEMSYSSKNYHSYPKRDASLAKSETKSEVFGPPAPANSREDYASPNFAPFLHKTLTLDKFDTPRESAAAGHVFPGLEKIESPRSLRSATVSASALNLPWGNGHHTPYSASTVPNMVKRVSTVLASNPRLASSLGDSSQSVNFSTLQSYSNHRSSTTALNLMKHASMVSLTCDEPSMNLDENESSEMRQNLHGLIDSQKGYLRRINRTMSLINSKTIERIQKEFSRQNIVEGTPLRDVENIGVNKIRYRETIDFWREFRNIKFYKSKTVTRVVHNILKTVLPDIGVTYAEIINEFLNADWPIGIFLHGGLLRDILTSTIGNDVDITFTCSHLEMKEICDKKGWKSRIRENMPYWVVGGEVDFETKLEGFPLSFNGLAKYQVSDFAANTLYYDCKNEIIIDRYGKGVEAALKHQITLSVNSPEEWDEWRNADYFVGAKLFRFYKFVIRGFDYDVDEARYVQESIQKFVTDALQDAVQSCWRAVKPLAREQSSREKALEYKAKLRQSVIKVYMQTMSANESEGNEFWVQYWEPLMYGVMKMGTYDEDRASSDEDVSIPMVYHANREILVGGEAESGAEAGY